MVKPISEELISYEVRLSNTLENVIAKPQDLKRLISVEVRLHTFKVGEAQTINIEMKVDSTII